MITKELLFFSNLVCFPLQALMIMNQRQPTLLSPQEKLLRLVEAGLLNLNPTWEAKASLHDHKSGMQNNQKQV